LSIRNIFVFGWQKLQMNFDHVWRSAFSRKILKFILERAEWEASTATWILGRLRLKCDGTCAETRFRLSARGTSPFKSAGASVQSTTGSRGVRISGSNAGYIMFRGSVKSSPFASFPFTSPPRVTLCHHISTRLYHCVI
jgi:hypothetical protein